MDNDFSALDQLAETPAPSSDAIPAPDFASLDALDTKKPKKLAVAPPPPGKVTPDVVRARLAKTGVTVPDDVFNDFYQVANHESGRGHYNSDGSVKRGPTTASGDRAIGYGQIMPGTAAKYKKHGLDPFDEADNQAMSIAEFAQGGGDPIARRLAYVGGPNPAKNKALAHYLKTGDVPDWKLYSYLPKNKETYRDYVNRSGGFNNHSVLDSLAGENDRSVNGAPQVHMGLGGIVEPDAPSAQDTALFEQMFGKKVPRPGMVAPDSTAPQLPGAAAPIDGTALVPPALPGRTADEAEANAANVNAQVPDLEQISQLAKQGEQPAERPIQGLQDVAQDTDGHSYQLAPDQSGLQPGQTRRVRDGHPFIFDGSKITQEGAVTAPDWATGKTPPVTPLPQDPALQQAYQQRIKAGVPDTEELRQKFIAGYNAVKAGKQQTIFTPEEQQFLGAVDTAKTQVATTGKTDINIQPQLQVKKDYSEGDFAQWAEYNKVPTDDAHRTLFEQQLKAAGPGSVTADAEVKDVAKADKFIPTRDHYENITLPYNLTGKPANMTNREYLQGQYAEAIANREGVPYEAALQAVQQSPLNVGKNADGGAADEAYFETIRKSGGTGATEISGATIRNAVEIANRSSEKRGETQDLLNKWGDNPRESPIAKQLQASIYVGAAGKDAGTELMRENEAYRDWMEKTGYDKESYLNSHQEEFARDREGVIKQFGSFAALNKQREQSDQYYKDKPYSIALGMGPDYEKSVAAVQSYERPRLSDQQLQDARDLGSKIKGFEAATSATGSFNSQFLTTAVADLTRMSAGAGRILKYTNPIAAIASAAGVDVDKVVNPEVFARQVEVVGEAAQGDGLYFKYTGMGGRGAGGLPGLTIATITAGGNPILGFGLHSALTNTDKPIAEQLKGIATDVALGGAFAGIGAVGRWIGSKAANAYLTPEIAQALNAPAAENTFVDAIKTKALKIQALAEQGGTEGEKEAGRTVLGKFLEKNGLTEADLAEGAVPKMNPALETAMKRAAVAKTVAEKGSSIGLVMATGYTVSKLQGASDSKAGEEAVLWGAMEAVMGVLHKDPHEPWTAEDIAAADGRVVRVPDAEGKPHDVMLVSDGEKIEGRDVTGQTPPDVVDAQILPKEGKKSVGPPSKDEGKSSGPATEMPLDPTPEPSSKDEEPPAATPEKSAEVHPLDALAGEDGGAKDVLAKFGQYDQGDGKAAVQGLNLGEPAKTDEEKGFTISKQGQSKGQGVAALKEQRDTERRKAETDALTQVANRHALDRALPSAEADPNTSVISFDANNFGQINKKHGEDEGDKALQDVAKALTVAASENGGRVFRKGGDEFVVLAPKEKAETIRARAEALVGERPYDGFTMSVSGSVGDTFADANEKLQDAKKARKADIAAKGETRNMDIPEGFWERIQSGSTDHAGLPRNVLFAAEEIRKAGGLQKPAEAGRFLSDYMKDVATKGGGLAQGPEFHKAFQEIIDKYSPKTVSGEDVYNEVSKLPDTENGPANAAMDDAKVKAGTFERKRVGIDDLLASDSDLKDFVKRSPATPGRPIEAPIVIANNVSRGGPARRGVVDGFHRIAQAIANGDKDIDAYVESTPLHESDIQHVQPEDLLGKVVHIDGEDQPGRLMEIRGRKAVVDYLPVKIGGTPVFGKRSIFPLEQLSIDSGKLSDLIKDETPEKPTKGKSKDVEAVPVERVPEGTSVAEERRKAGQFERDGVTYERPADISTSTPRGKSERVKFSNSEDPTFHYQLIEAKQLHPADLGGNPNPYHFLPEAQPKDRSGKASANASDKIAANINLDEIGANRIAYSGAPITNARGEVIQGNSRSEGILKHYGAGSTDYKRQLEQKAADYGFEPKQVASMEQPVLVRMLDVPDDEAIKLGNLDAKDLETGGKIGINPVATAARIPFADKHTMLQDVFLGAQEDSTLNQLIKANSDRIGRHLQPYITEAQSESLFNKNTFVLTPQGTKEIEQLFTHFLFDKGHPSLPDLFEGLPYNAKNAVIGSLPKIFSVPQEQSLVPDIQNAIIAATQFDAVGIPNFDDWSRQADMFTEGRAPLEVYTPLELALARLFVESTSQKQIRKKFADYALAVNGAPKDLFGDSEPGVDKPAAVKSTFDVEYSPETKYAENQPDANDSQRSEPTSETAAQEAAAPEAPADGNRNAEDQKGGVTSADKYFAPEALAEAANQNAKSREKLIHMPIDEFLSMAEQIPANASGEKAERVSHTLASGEKFPTLPFLLVNPDGHVRGHEGRHRALELKAQGETHIPVIFVSDNIRWGSQEEGNPDRVESFPERLTSEDGKRNIPFPVKQNAEEIKGSGNNVTVPRIEEQGQTTESPLGSSPAIAAGANATAAEPAAGASTATTQAGVAPKSKVRPKGVIPDDLTEAEKAHLSEAMPQENIDAYAKRVREGRSKGWVPIGETIKFRDDKGKKREGVIQDYYTSHGEVYAINTGKHVYGVNADHLIDRPAPLKTADELGAMFDDLVPDESVKGLDEMSAEDMEREVVANEKAIQKINDEDFPGDSKDKAAVTDFYDRKRARLTPLYQRINALRKATQDRFGLPARRSLDRARRAAGYAGMESSMHEPSVIDSKNLAHVVLKLNDDLTDAQKRIIHELQFTDRKHANVYVSNDGMMGFSPTFAYNSAAEDIDEIYDRDGKRISLLPKGDEWNQTAFASSDTVGLDPKADAARHLEISKSLLGNDLGEHLHLLRENGETMPKAGAAAKTILAAQNEIAAKGKGALDLAGEALAAIEEYARDEMMQALTKGFEPGKGGQSLSPLARQMYQELAVSGMALNQFKTFGAMLKGLNDGDAVVADDKPYIGPNMTTHEIARQLVGPMMSNGFNNIGDARRLVGEMLGHKVESGTPLAKQVDEAVELAVVIQARALAAHDFDVPEKFKRLVDLYDRQPNLSVRTTTSIAQQAYSTPAPLAFAAARLAGIDLGTSVYEPSAGNGMLLMTAAPELITANELNPDRAGNLQATLGDAADVTEEDAANYVPPGEFDAVIANPPFGTLDVNGKEQTWKINDKYTTNQLDHAIALKALGAMKGDGRAVLIVGGAKGESAKDRKQGYEIQAKRAFYKTLYDNYNVVDHFTVSGDLYKKQGAGFPVDVIVIHGRGKSARRLPALDIPALLKTWDEVGGKLEDGSKPDTTTAGLGLPSMDAPEGGRSGATSRSGGRKKRPGTDQGTVFDLLGSQGGSTGEQPAKPEEGSGVPDAGATGQRSPRPRDFSDAAEHGDGLDSRQPADEGAIGEPGRNDESPAVTGDQRPEGRTGAADNGHGELDVKPPSVDDLKTAVSALDDLMNDTTMLSIVPEEGDKEPRPSEPPFNEEFYAKARPHFQTAYDYFKGKVKTIEEAMVALIKHLKEEYKWPSDKIRKLKKYIVRFMQDVQTDIVARTKADTPQRQERPDISPEMAASSTQLVYVPQSKGQPMETLLPANLYTATVNALNKLESEVGDIDEYVAKKLGYNHDNGEIYNYFGGEQIDAIALAVYNMENDGALVLGDQTGVGKGRVVAGLIKYAMREGMVPVFFTEKDNLYKDIYRDLTDIGMNDVSPLMVDANKAIALDDNKTVWLKTTGGHNNTLKKMMANGEVDPQYNIVFATYYGLQLPNVRRDFLRQFAQNTVVVMDESHNAGGDGTPPRVNDDGSVKLNRALAAREIVQNAKGVLYSSATWAKRPDVMSLYAKTDMKLAVPDINQLGDAIGRGGVPLQQVVSSMLAESGQYLRRERDFEGISYDTPVVAVDKENAENLSKSIRDIFHFSEAVKAAVSNNTGGIMDELLSEGGAALGNPAVNAEAIGFAQTMHNVIAQMLLALKVDAAVDKAIEQLKLGHKPVITMANTMGALIEEYANDLGWTPGDAVDIDFGAVLKRYLDKSRHVRVGSAFGESETIRLTDDQLGAELRSQHDGVKAWIDRQDWSKLPASPIDYMHSRLQTAGYKTAEITGRSHALQYNPGGTIIYRIRPGKEKTVQGKTDTITGFNNGGIDVILLNQSGSTGLSLHASEKFKDQRKRVMILAQAEANIDTHMQMLGRVNRTGQIIKPAYMQLTADIPAEKRPAAVLAKKMASLNANTTGAVDSAVKAKETLDFINEYGDQIVAQYLSDNTQMHQDIGSPLPQGDGAGLEFRDAARKATGRLPMLSLAEQEEFYDAVASMYESYIDQLNQLGENRLEAQTLPLEAVTTGRIKVFDGPGGDSPFGQHAYAETVTVKKLTRPRSKDEVLKILQERLKAPGVTDRRTLMGLGRDETQAWWKEQLGLIRPYIESELDKLDDSDKIASTRARLEGLKYRIQNALAAAAIGSTVEVKLGSEYYYGAVSDIRRIGRAKTPLALSDYEVTVLTTDASRQLRIPMSQIYSSHNPPPAGTQMSAIVTPMTSQPDIMGTRADIMDAFDHGQNVRTEERQIMTGNLLASFSKFENGRVINFTTKDGQIRQGILMPMNFNVEKALDDMPVQFKTSTQMIDFLTSGDRIIEDKSGEVRMSHRAGALYLQVPKAKARGARFFNNKEILHFAGKDFVTAGQNMVLRNLNDAQAQNILDSMINMGVEFHTNVFKPQARELVGASLPEREVIAHEQDPEQVAYENAITQRKEAAARLLPFEPAEFNHTRSGAQMFVAKYKDLQGTDPNHRQWDTLSRKNGGYYSSYTRDGAVPGFLFKTAENRQSFMNDVQAQVTPDTTMLSIYDEGDMTPQERQEEEDRRNAVRILKQVPLTDLAPAADIARTNDRIKLNLPAMELLRRAFEQVDIDAGKRKFGEEKPYPSFLGVFPDPARAAKAATTIEGLGRQAEQNGLPNLGNRLIVFANEINDAMKVGRGTVVFYVLDSKLPQEIFHQGMYLGSTEKALTRRHADPKGLDNSPEFRKADKAFFSKQSEYSVDNIMDTQKVSLSEARELRNATIREEIAAWVAEGSAKKIGLTEDEGDEYLLKFMQSFAGKVYADVRRAGGSDAEATRSMHNALDRFKDIDYAKNAVESVISPQSVGRDNEEGPGDIESGEPQGPTESPANSTAGATSAAPEPDTESEPTDAIADGPEPVTEFGTRVKPEPDASRLQGVRDNPGVRSKEDTARTPRTMRAAGIAADEIIYTVFSDKAAQVEAAAFIDEHGFDGAIKLLKDQKAIPDPDVHHAVATFSIMKVLQDEATRVEATNPKLAEEIRQQSLDLGTSLSIRMTRAGRLVRAASVILKNTRSVVELARTIYQDKHGKSAELPAAVEERVASKGRQAESALAEHESLVKQMKALEREVEDLKTQIKGQSPITRTAQHVIASRRKLVSTLKARHGDEIERARERLQQRSLVTPKYSVNAAGDPDTTMLSVYDESQLDPAILADFAKVGADLLVEGLSSPKMMRPVDFDEQMVSLFGEAIQPHLEAIHREALRLRNDWLADLAKERMAKSIIQDFGVNLTQEEIDAIVQERSDEIVRRGAIMRLHNLRAERGQKVKDLSAIESLIAEIAPNPPAAAAATELVHNKPSAHELYRTLEALGYTGQEARNAFRQGTETLAKAKVLHAKRKAELAEEMRNRIDAAESDLTDLQKMVAKSRTRARESQHEISKELKRISSGEFGFYKNLVMETVNTPRAIMASTDLSFLLRQGGWFMFARPLSQKAAFSTMINSFTEKLNLKGYDAAMAEMEQNPYFEEAVRVGGIDFAGLGKHGEFSITKGEEEFRNNIFGMISNVTEGTAVHNLNAARIPNAIIRKSDELYTAFLDAQRLATYADSATYFKDKLGLTPEENPKEFRALGAYINDATGRSDVGSSKTANLIMNLPLFAPRFTISRFKMLYKSTVGMPFLPPATRRVVFRDSLGVYAVLGSLIALAWMGGKSAGLNFDDADFLKIKIGDNHLDPFFGMQQALRPGLQLAALAIRGAFGYPRENIRLTKDKKNDAGEVIGSETYASEVKTMLFDLEKGVPASFIRRKLSPFVSLPIDRWLERDAVGQPFTWQNAILSRTLPIGAADFGAAAWSGNPVDTALATTSLLGLGYSRYPDRPNATGLTPAEELARKINALRFQSSSPDPKKQDVQAKLNDLRDRARAGEDVGADLDQLVSAGKISSADKQRIVKGAKQDYFTSQIASMPADGLRMVRGVANDEQRAQIDAILGRRDEKKEKKDERAEARTKLFGTPEPKAETKPKSLADQLAHANVEDSMVLYQANLDKLSSAQQFEALQKIKTKVLHSNLRGTLTRERYDAAKKLLGDQLQVPFHEPGAKKVKPVKGLDSLKEAY